MKNGRNYGNIERLIDDFVKAHHKTPYFELQPYIAYLRAAYALGIGDAQVRHVKPVVRGDGKLYKSIQDAATANGVNERSIRRALENKTKSGGYFWLAA